MYRFGFVMEQTLGQITHTQNFQYWTEKDPEVSAKWMLVSYEHPRLRLPLVGRNWTLRASLDARTQAGRALRSEPLDLLLFHTQVTALFSHGLMSKIPAVVSMDATPLNFDAVGAGYAHQPSAVPQVESLKNLATRRTFHRARQLIIWHHWGKRSLVEQYGVPADRVHVIPPGIDVDRWRFDRPELIPGRPVRLLFVGGDFRRKGGETLLAAFQRDLSSICELDIVTRDEVDVSGLNNVRVHRNLKPNTAALLDLYARADVFVFPTLADVLPLAVMEAMASGLPVLTTDVGAIGEAVRDGVTGLLVPPGNVDALSAATRRLVEHPDARRQMGADGRRSALEQFNGAINYQKMLTVCKDCVDRARTDAGPRYRASGAGIGDPVGGGRA